MQKRVERAALGFKKCTLKSAPKIQAWRGVAVCLGAGKCL